VLPGLIIDAVGYPRSYRRLPAGLYPITIIHGPADYQDQKPPLSIGLGDVPESRRLVFQVDSGRIENPEDTLPAAMQKRWQQSADGDMPRQTARFIRRRLAKSYSNFAGDLSLASVFSFVVVSNGTKLGDQ
jgi:hypothetical protein